MEPTDDPQTKKRLRARQSCDSCRQRKTRCNADDTFPCSTCTSLGTECHLSKRRKRGPMPAAYVEALEDRIKRLEQTLTQHGMSEGPANDGAGGRHRSSASPSSASSRSTASSPSRFNGASGDTRSPSSSTNSPKPSSYNTTLYIGRSAGYYTLDEAGNEYEVEKTANDKEDDHLILPSSELQPASSPSANARRSTGKSSCRQRRFEPFKDIPNMTLELADAMVGLYFRDVHSTSPFLCKIGFLEEYYFQNPHPPDEYLLYAICAVGCKFMSKEKDIATKYNVSLSTLQKLHRALQEKAEKLLEFVFRRSNISTVCVLLLLASFSPNPELNKEDDRLQWFMVGTAIRMAQDLGLHRSSTRWRLPENEIELRRRVWYSVYGIDREMSAALGRPLTIMDGDYDVELPSPYEIASSYGPETRKVDDNEPVPDILLEAERDLRERRPIYASAVCFVPFARILGKTLSSLYSSIVPSIEHTEMIEVAKKLASEVDELAENTRRQLSTLSPAKDDLINQEVLTAYHSFLNLLIHRSFISDRDMSNIDFALHSLSVCTLSAIAIMDSVERMETIGPSNMPWSFISYLIFQTAIIFLFHAKSDNSFLRQLGARNLARCANIYRNDDELRDSLPARMLMSLAAKYSVPMESIGDLSNILATTIDHPGLTAPATSEHVLAISVGGDTPSTRQQEHTNTAMLNTMQPYSHAAPMTTTTVAANHQAPAMMPSTPTQQHLTATPDEFNNLGDMQFDLTGLSSEMELWEFPTAITWNEWNPYL